MVRDDVQWIIDQKHGGVIGVLMGLQVLSQELTSEDFAKFCGLVPDGEELWLAFRARRDAPEAKEGYNFRDYAQEVLAEHKD